MTTINDIHDLARILRENPDWAETMRGILLGKELLELPETAARMARLTADTAETSQKALELLEELTRQTASQGGTLSRLEGAQYQAHVALHAFRPLADRLELSRLRLLHNSQADQGTALREHLINMGINTDGTEFHSLVPADLVYTATRRKEQLYILCEISITAGEDDFRRASDRATVLNTLTGMTTIAAVIGTRMVESIPLPSAETRPTQPDEVVYIPVHRNRP